MCKSLTLKTICKIYQDEDAETMAIENFSYTFERGHFTSIVGPSGCGKTTTLKIIAGFETADSGELMFKNEDISALPPYKRQVNTVFQKYALFPHMNIFDNIAFGLKLKTLPKNCRFT